MTTGTGCCQHTECNDKLQWWAWSSKAADQDETEISQFWDGTKMRWKPWDGDVETKTTTLEKCVDKLHWPCLTDIRNTINGSLNITSWKSEWLNRCHGRTAGLLKGQKWVWYPHIRSVLLIFCEVQCAVEVYFYRNLAGWHVWITLKSHTSMAIQMLPPSSSGSRSRKNYKTCVQKYNCRWMQKQ